MKSLLAMSLIGLSSMGLTQPSHAQPIPANVTVIDFYYEYGCGPRCQQQRWAEEQRHREHEWREHEWAQRTVSPGNGRSMQWWEH